jgi:hypothetical protein
VPHLPVIADVFRVTFHWSALAGADHPVSVQHFRATAAGDSADLAAQLDANKQTHQLEGLTTATAVGRIDILPLDGVTPTHSFTLANWFGESGGGGDPLIGQAIMLLGQSSVRGPRHRGRMFLPSPIESIITQGSITEANRAEIETAWNGFQTAMEADDWEWGVASYQAGGAFLPYVNIKIPPRLGRIRRRQF